MSAFYVYRVLIYMIYVYVIGVYMSTVVLSVRVRRELKEEAERLGINIREVVERALEEEIRRRKVELFKEILEKALDSMEVSVEEWVRVIKESRFER